MPRARANAVNRASVGRIACEPAMNSGAPGIEEIALGVDVDEDEGACEHGERFQRTKEIRGRATRSS